MERAAGARTAALVAGAVSVAVVLSACTNAFVAPVPASAPPTPAGALWQTTAMSTPYLLDGLVVGDDYDTSTVTALADATGRTAWRYIAPAGTHLLSGGIIGGSGVILVETEHSVGTPPGEVTFAVSSVIALDASTGRELWTTTIGGDTENLPLAISGGEVVIGDPVGVFRAYRARTGTLDWSAARPKGCGLHGDQRYDEGVAAAAGVLVTSYQCEDRRVVAERLAPANGRTLWRWASPVPSRTGYLTLTAAAASSQGDVAVLTGQIDGRTRDALGRTVKHGYEWPAALGPDGNDLELALDASSGAPRWAEFGAQEAAVTLTDGASCETAGDATLCRDDGTGRPTRPPLVTRLSSGPPALGEASAAVTGDSIAVALGPVGSQLTVLVTTVRGDRTIVRKRVPIATSPAGGARYDTDIVAAAPLGRGRIMALVQRVDSSQYPLTAIALPAA